MSSHKAHIREHERRQRRRRMFYGGIAIVVALAVVVAIASQRASESGAMPATAQTQPVVVTGTALPAFDSSAGTDPAVGTTIPTLSGASFDGTRLTVAPDGKPKVLLFVAHWCPHCDREVPLLAPDLRAHPLPAGVEMTTISTSVTPGGPNYPPAAWLAGVHWPTPVIADDAQSDAASAFGLTAFPYFVFVNAHGQVVARTSGEISLAQFREYVARIA
jgi:thiol-disulfide isomerase/thioredoxin